LGFDDIAYSKKLGIMVRKPIYYRINLKELILQKSIRMLSVVVLVALDILAGKSTV
jgi:hypothetical protein